MGKEKETMIDIMLEAYLLADQINQSTETQNYIYYKKRMEKDDEAQKLIKEFQNIKHQFEEAQRFGIFHPNYHQAKEKTQFYQKKLRSHPIIGSFMDAEDQLDQLLLQVTTIIANSVSKSIKVPSNDLQKVKKDKNKNCSKV